jgi:hypothetical protein
MSKVLVATHEFVRRAMAHPLPSVQALVLFWNSGIWNSFDPITLIEAVGVSWRRSARYLVLITMAHPNPAIRRGARRPLRANEGAFGLVG